MIFSLSLGLGIIVIVIAFIAEYVDSTIGMGYGTSLSPILLLMGFEPLQVVPAILLSELLTGFISSYVHHEMGNVNFCIKTTSPRKILEDIKKFGFIKAFNKGISTDLKIASLLSIYSVIGSIIAVIIVANVSSLFLKIYIGILVLGIGIYILITLKKNYEFSWMKLTGLAVLASFNKGISGGGYGPLVTGGQLLVGVNGKNAIAITSLAEGVTCIVGLVVYFISGSNIDWSLAPYLLIGGVFSIPLSGLTVKKISSINLRKTIGLATIVLGTYTLIKIFS